MNKALILSSVGKVFNQGEWNEINAVSSVSLSINWGESILLIGNNGSGKSTLLNLIAGTYPPTYGKLIIDSIDVTKLPSYKRSQLIYRIFQNPLHGVAVLGSIMENMAFSELSTNEVFSLNKLSRSDKELTYKEILNTLNPSLVNKLEHKIYLLSPGQQQAVTLAMLKIQNKGQRLLLADEPTAALDPHSAEICLTLIKEKVDSGWTSILITHDLSLINQHKGRIIKMEKGKVISDVIQ